MLAIATDYNSIPDTKEDDKCLVFSFPFRVSPQRGAKRRTQRGAERAGEELVTIRSCCFDTVAGQGRGGLHLLCDCRTLRSGNQTAGSDEPMICRDICELQNHNPYLHEKRG